MVVLSSEIEHWESLCVCSYVHVFCPSGFSFFLVAFCGFFALLWPYWPLCVGHSAGTMYLLEVCMLCLSPCASLRAFFVSLKHLY